MKRAFNRAASAISEAVGSHYSAFVGALLIVAWAASGPFLGFSDTWQLIINTTTTIVTFLMTLIIQYTQNRDTKAIHAKLDELIHVTTDARDELMGIEQDDPDAIEQIRNGDQ